MTNTETQYFALLRSALWGVPVVIDEPIDWDAILQLGDYHANAVLICGTASQMTSDNKPSPEMLAKMQMSMRANLLSRLQLKQVLAPAVRLLREHDIEPVLLKGFGLARLYPNPNLRQFGDIDLFVGLEKFHEACALLRTLPGGCHWCEEVDSGRHYNIDFGKYPMEIHRVSADVIDPKENTIYAAIERDGLYDNAERVDFEGLSFSVPSKEFMVFFTFFHAWHHFTTSGVGWRQISDVAMALHVYQSSSELDFDKLRQWLTAMHLMKPWQAFGYLMVECLGLPQAEMPYYEAGCRRTAHRLYRRIMDEGNFNRKRNFKNDRPKKRWKQKIHALICIFIDFFHLFRVFPASAYRELHVSLRYAFTKNLN